VPLLECPRCRTQVDAPLGVDPSAQRCACGSPLAAGGARAWDTAVLRCASCGATVASADPACGFCGTPIERDERLRSRLCASCCARSASDARFCTACGRAFESAGVEADPALPNCPVCRIGLHAQRVAEFELAECRGCHGLWIPHPGFDALVERALELRRKALASPEPAANPRVSKANPHAQTVRYLRCPACSEQLARRNFRRSSGVILDVCRRCGVWLDAGELEAIAGFLARGGETSPAFREEEQRCEVERIRLAERAKLEIDAAGTTIRGSTLAELLAAIFD
jgi:Zn-finger nucleic acid-binding protein